MYTDKLRKLVARELQQTVEAVGPDAGMEILEQWDSIAHINICLAVQAEFGIEMSVDEIAEATSIAQLATLLAFKRGEPSAGASS